MHFDLRPCCHSLCGWGIASYLKMDGDRRKRDDRAVDPKQIQTGKNGTEERSMNFEGNTTASWTTTPADTRTESPAAKKMTSKPLDEAGEKLAAEMKVFNDVASELKAAMDVSASYEARVQSLTSAAAELFGLAPTWTAFYREILGADGVMKKCVCGPEMATFECSAEHSKLLEMLTVLRSRDLPENDPHEQQRMITVRIPKSLHDSICEEANELAVSVNKLCISRLLQKVDKSMIPTSSQKRRGRRPGTVATKGNEPEVGDDFS